MSEGRRRFHDRLAGIESGAESERLAPLLSALADGEACTEDLQTRRARPARGAGSEPERGGEFAPQYGPGW